MGWGEGGEGDGAVGGSEKEGSTGSGMVSVVTCRAMQPAMGCGQGASSFQWFLCCAVIGCEGRLITLPGYFVLHMCYIACDTAGNKRACMIAVK